VRTLAQCPEHLSVHIVHPGACATGRVVVVHAPCCGRRIAADAILDVRGVPGTIVAGGGRLTPRDHDWLCDSCRQRLYADPSNAWSRSRLYAAVGASPEHVRALHARELAEQVAAWDRAAARAHQPGEVLATILAAELVVRAPGGAT
jgi:hypothetical protein